MNRYMILTVLLTVLIVLAWAVLITSGLVGSPFSGGVGQDGLPIERASVFQEKCPCGMCACSTECHGDACDCTACACKKCGCPR
jgi:hypothetical protein